MLNLSSLFLMLSFLLLPSAYAEESDNKKILVEQAWTDVANKKFYSDQINKIVIQTIAKYRGYEFFMSNANLGKDTILNRLKIVVKKRQKNLHFVEVLQMSGRNNQPLKGSWADNVPERFILLQIRVSVAEALYGRKIAMEVMQTLKDQDNAFKEFMEKRSPQDNSIDREEKDLPEKAPPPAESKKKVTSNQSEEDDEDEDPATEYNSSLTTNQTLPQYLEMKENRMMARAVKAQSKAVTDQSEEIEDVQAAVRKGMKERKSSKGKDEEKAADQKSFLDLSSPDQQKAPRPPFEKSTRPRVTRTILDTVYLNRFVYTKYIVESNNNFNFMGGRFTYRNNLSDTSGDDLVLSAMYLKALDINDTQYEIPPLINTHFQFLGTSDYLPFDYIIGLHYDKEFFVTLAELNQGMKVVETQIVWAQFGLERTFQWGNFLAVFQILYAQNIYSKSNFLSSADLQMQATRLGYGGELFYKRLSLGVYISKEQAVSNTFSEFQMMQDSWYLNASYTF